MSFISSDSCSPFQNDEAAAIEAVVRAAVLSIMKALLDARDMRTKSYQEKLAEMEQENLQLKIKLKAAEGQLQIVQQQHHHQHFASAGESCEVSATLTFSPSSSQSLNTLMGGEEVSSQNVCEREALDCKLYKEEPADEEKFWIKNEVAEEEPSVYLQAHLGRTGSGQLQQVTMPVQTCGACNSHNHSVQEENAVLTILERSMQPNSSV